MHKSTVAKATHIKIKLTLVSVSQTFCKQLFSTKLLCAEFLYLKFGLVTFWQRNIGEKAAHKMLTKLTTGANAINISGLLV